MVTFMSALLDGHQMSISLRALGPLSGGFVKRFIVCVSRLGYVTELLVNSWSYIPKLSRQHCPPSVCTHAYHSTLVKQKICGGSLCVYVCVHILTENFLCGVASMCIFQSASERCVGHCLFTYTCMYPIVLRVFVHVHWVGGSVLHLITHKVQDTHRCLPVQFKDH